MHRCAYLAFRMLQTKLTRLRSQHNNKPRMSFSRKRAFVFLRYDKRHHFYVVLICKIGQNQLLKTARTSTDATDALIQRCRRLIVAFQRAFVMVPTILASENHAMILLLQRRYMLGFNSAEATLRG